MRSLASRQTGDGVVGGERLSSSRRPEGWPRSSIWSVSRLTVRLSPGSTTALADQHRFALPVATEERFDADDSGSVVGAGTAGRDVARPRPRGCAARATGGTALGPVTVSRREFRSG